MTIGVILVAVSAGLDVFAGGLSLGIAHLPRERWPWTAAAFSAIGVTLLAAGLLLGRLLSDNLGDFASYVAGAVLLLIGLRTLRGLFWQGSDHQQEAVPLNSRAILLTGVAVSFDKLAIGLALAVADFSISLALTYAALISFVSTLMGLSLGARLGSRLGAPAHAVGGLVFVVLGVVIIYKTATGGAAV
jgi:putative Mn2+ efflux pump MntP